MVGRIQVCLGHVCHTIEHFLASQGEKEGPRESDQENAEYDHESCDVQVNDPCQDLRVGSNFSAMSRKKSTNTGTEMVNAATAVTLSS